MELYKIEISNNINIISKYGEILYFLSVTLYIIFFI